MTGRHARPSPAQRRREARRITETSDYAAMMIRVVYGYGARIGDDPAALAHLRGIEAALRDAVNMGIFTANTAGTRPYSLGEIAAILGITRQGIHKRGRLGEEAHVRPEAARAPGGAVRPSA